MKCFRNLVESQKLIPKWFVDRVYSALASQRLGRKRELTLKDIDEAIAQIKREGKDPLYRDETQ